MKEYTIGEWEKIQSSYWSKISEHYDDLYNKAWSEYEDQKLKKLLKKLKLNSLSVLDLGCGTGLGYSIVNEINAIAHYVGIDFSKLMLIKFKEKFDIEGLYLKSIDKANCFQDKQFTLIISFNTSFSFSYDVKNTLFHIEKILDSNGCIVLSFINRLSLRKILKFNFFRIEKYSTRGTNRDEYCLANTFTRKEFDFLLKKVGYKNINFYSQSILAGVLEKTYLIKLDKFLTKLFPFLTHTYYVSAEKIGE